jgi:hypothetical protein
MRRAVICVTAGLAGVAIGFGLNSATSRSTTEIPVSNAHNICLGNTQSGALRIFSSPANRRSKPFSLEHLARSAQLVRLLCDKTLGGKRPKSLSSLKMTFNEMRLVKHLVESAREIAQDERELLDTYEGFECMMWSDDDADLKKWQVTRRQFHRCLRLAFAELKRS